MLAAGAEAVVVNGRSRERGERAIAAIAARFPEARIALALCDMAEVADAQAVVSAAIDTLGRVDVLVNSTGTNDFPKLIHAIALEDIPGILQRCLTAQLLSCRAVLPHMRAANGGCIINIASDAAKIPTPGETVIGAAMAGIVMFTRALAIEGKRNGIRANVLTPSIVGGTEFYDRLMADPFAGKLFGSVLGHWLDIGIGVNSGDMIAGNIGSSAIMSYTVIGDNVNLGSRLESLNKEYKTRIIISDATRTRLVTAYDTRPLGDVVVKGKSTAVAIFEVKVQAPLIEVQTT